MGQWDYMLARLYPTTNPTTEPLLLLTLQTADQLKQVLSSINDTPDPSLS